MRSAHPSQLYREDGVSTANLLWIGVGLVVAYAVVANIPDLVRYIKISRM